jgi:hypothetical protein
MKKASLTFLIIGKLTGTFLIYFLLASCKKDKAVNLPRVVTYDVTNITPSSATLNGSLLSKGSVNIDFRGVCWSTSPNPVMEGTNGPNLNFMWMGFNPPSGDFSYDISVFKPGTTYYVRTMVRYYYGNGGVINDVIYGNEVSFATP